MSRNISYTFRRSLFSTILIALIFLAPSCKKEPQVSPDVNNDEFIKVNSWVTEQMRYWYYWNKSIPANAGLNLTLHPEDFFESILDKEDRFSWIDNVDRLKEDLAGVSTSTGLNFGLFGYNDAAVGFIRYVIPGSPSDKAGIKRGMFFTKVNGRAMGIDNYNTILAPYYEGKDFSIQLADLSESGITPTSEVSLSVEEINEPAIHLYKIITSQSGKKVGYLFYNRFLSDTDNTDELFEAFQYFKANGVQDLILDIRYNLGGSISVSGLLSGLIMPDYDADKYFVEYKYNDDLNELYDGMEDDSRRYKFKDLFSENMDAKVQGANLNLNKVYVLATYNSASASELVINNLRPYMGVVHIGDTTRGKNEGSVTLEDKRKPREIDWAIQPIILKLANADRYGDYHNGLSPTIQNDEGYILKPLGDEEDPLVRSALEQIDPRMTAKSRITPPRVLNMLRGIKNFEEINNKARPVLVDETINKEMLRRRVK